MRIDFLLICLLVIYCPSLTAQKTVVNHTIDCHGLLLPPDGSTGAMIIEMGLRKTKSTIGIGIDKTSGIPVKTLILTTESKDCSGQKGIYIKLSNYDILAFEEISLACTDWDDGRHTLAGTLVLTDDLYRQLAKYDIRHFNLGGNDVDVVYEDPKEFGIILKCVFEEN